jgi:hypothetical protein
MALSDAVLIEAAGGGAAPTGTDRVQVVPGSELVARFEESALVTWHDDRPQIDREYYSFLRESESFLPSLDALGLQWLPSLALNKKPPGLAHLSEVPERLFERIAFRVFTTVFRFGGSRKGERYAGKRAPDAVLRSPSESENQFSALMDCKAARDGYVMDADDERALTEYVETQKAELETSESSLKYVVIVSSSFPGSAGDRHPYHGRAAKFTEQGVKLVYLRAADLVRIAIAVEQADMQPSERELIDWGRIFDHGLVPADVVSDVIDGMKAG